MSKSLPGLVEKIINIICLAAAIVAIVLSIITMKKSSKIEEKLISFNGFLKVLQAPVNQSTQ